MADDVTETRTPRLDGQGARPEGLNHGSSSVSDSRDVLGYSAEEKARIRHLNRRWELKKLRRRDGLVRYPPAIEDYDEAERRSWANFLWGTGLYSREDLSRNFGVDPRVVQDSGRAK